jgi:hypothetical protein
MKRFFIVLAISCTVCSGIAQAQEMEKGKSLLNAGLGFIPGWGLNVSYDYGLVDKWGPGIFTIGAYAGFENWGKTYHILLNSESYRANAFAFAPRATYRYAVNSSFEVYGAAMLGAVIYSYSEYLANESKPLVGITAGCRYSFASNLSVFAAVGYGISYLNGGVSFSF